MSETSEAAAKIYNRIDSVDFLRGLVMVIMLLDHTREYVHADAFRFSPTDLSKTNVLLFFTRWITHLCAPTFVLLAGTSIRLQMLRGKSRSELSKFLLTRGLWLIFLEFTIVRFAIFFNFDYSFLGLAEVIWVFGVSMIALAALIFLPTRVVGIIGIAMIALHNLLDKIQVPPATSMAGNARARRARKAVARFASTGFCSAVSKRKDVRRISARALDWSNGGGIFARRGLRLGNRATPPFSVQTRIHSARSFRRHSRDKYLRRPAAMDDSADCHFHDFVFSQHNEIPAFAPFSADDARLGTFDFGLCRRREKRWSFEPNNNYLRARPSFLFHFADVRRAQFRRFA